MMLSVAASAQLTLTSTTGSMASPVYHYDITVTNTGSTQIGTFWFAWVPGEDFLPTAPLTESNPAGWGSVLTGSGDSSDGTAIQWIANSNAIATGATLSGFDFTSSDSPAALAGESPSHPGETVMTSTVYSGAPFSDSGFTFAVTPAAVVALGASTTTLAASQSSIDQGDSVTLTATVAPSSGSGADPTGTVTFLENGNSLGTAPVTNGVAALTTSSLPSGSLSLTAQYGGDATYSVSTSATIGETVTNPAILVPTIAKSTLPAALVAGAAAHGNVTVDIAKATAAAIKAKITIELFASVDGSIDGSAIQLAQVVKSLNVKTTGPASATFPIKVAAATLPAGSYTLLARVVDLSGNSNDSSAGPTVAVAAPFVALSETFVKTTVPPTAAAGAKAHAVAVLQITNNGNITTPGMTTVALFATASGVVDGAATRINSVTKALKIKVGKSATVSIPVKLIPPIAAGAYTIVAQVTDPNGQITTAISGVVTITA